MFVYSNFDVFCNHLKPLKSKLFNKKQKQILTSGTKQKIIITTRKLFSFEHIFLCWEDSQNWFQVYNVKLHLVLSNIVNQIDQSNM